MNNYPTYKLNEICKISTGKWDANHAVEDGRYRFYTCSNKFTMCDTASFNGECVIVPGNGDLGLLFYYNGEFDAYQRTYVLSDIKIYPKYLYYHMMYKWRSSTEKLNYGSTIKYVRITNFTSYEIEVPDKTTQHAIVTRIETLFAELDKAMQHLRTAQQQLKTYRQAVLNHSFSNETWKNVSITDIIEKEKNSLKAGPFGSSLKKEYYVEDGYKVYGQEQVISGDPFIGNYYIDEDKYKELESCKIKSGDVLISLVGTVGKILILPENIKPGIINPRLIKITLNRQMYDSKFFKYYFESSQVKSFYKINASGTTMDVLNIGIIKQIPFPLPPLAEQQRIVKEIESRLSQATATETYIENALQQAEALRQSILKKAFSGELV